MDEEIMVCIKFVQAHAPLESMIHTFSIFLRRLLLEDVSLYVVMLTCDLFDMVPERLDTGTTRRMDPGDIAFRTFPGQCVKNREIRRQPDSCAYEHDGILGCFVLTGVEDKFACWMRDLQNVANAIFIVKDIRDVALVSVCIGLSEIQARLFRDTDAVVR